MRTSRSLLALIAAVLLATSLAVACTPTPTGPPTATTTTTTSTAAPTTTTTSTTLVPPHGSCHMTLPGSGLWGDWWYTDLPNVANNLWYTESFDGSCTGPVHTTLVLGPVTIPIVGLASDLPAGSMVGETAMLNCLAMGGTGIDLHPLDSNLAGFRPTDYLCRGAAF
jgi:hypothetical protein